MKRKAEERECKLRVGHPERIPRPASVRNPRTYITARPSQPPMISLLYRVSRECCIEKIEPCKPSNWFCDPVQIRGRTRFHLKKEKKRKEIGSSSSKAKCKNHLHEIDSSNERRNCENLCGPRRVEAHVRLKVSLQKMCRDMVFGTTRGLWSLELLLYRMRTTVV
jgi:hypothetical protein